MPTAVDELGEVLSSDRLVPRVVFHLAPQSLTDLQKKLLGTKYLPSALCFRQFIDFHLLEYDIADPTSLISKKLSPAEIAAVREERKNVLHRCVQGVSVSIPPLYLLDPTYTAEHAAADFAHAHAERWVLRCTVVDCGVVVGLLGACLCVCACVCVCVRVCVRVCA